MKNFTYYNKNDISKEPIGKIQAIDLEDAINIAAHIKHLSIDDFLKIFEMKEIK